MSNEPIAERLGRAAWADSPVRGPDETWEDLPDVGQQAWIRIGQAVRFALDADARIAELESQLGQAHEALTVLQDAARPAAALLLTIAQRGLEDLDIHIIAQTLAPLDAVLAATKQESK